MHLIPRNEVPRKDMGSFIEVRAQQHSLTRTTIEINFAAWEMRAQIFFCHASSPVSQPCYAAVAGVAGLRTFTVTSSEAFQGSLWEGGMLLLKKTHIIEELLGNVVAGEMAASQQWSAGLIEELCSCHPTRTTPRLLQTLTHHLT